MTDITNADATDNDIEVSNTELDTSSSDLATPQEAPEVPQAEEGNDLRGSIAKALNGLQTPEEAAAKPASALPKAAAAPKQEPQVDPVTGRIAEPMKAPPDWTPALREKWNGIDPQVQKFLLDRSRDMNMALQQAAEARKGEKQFREIAATMEAVLKQFNQTPMQHAKELFDLSYALNTGDPVQKAHIFVNLLNHFRPDPAALQALLGGQQVPVRPMTPAPRPQSREDIAEEVLREREAAKEAQTATEAITAFGNDPANEFFHDVKVMMGKLIEAGLVEGSTTQETLKNAYDLAVSRHPEIQPILAARGAQAPAQQPLAQAQPQARPVGSVKPSLGSGKQSRAPTKTMTAREAALAAYEATVGR